MVAAFREDATSLATVAHELRLRPDDIRDLTFGLVLQSAGPDSPAGRPKHENAFRPDLRLVRSRSTGDTSLNLFQLACDLH